MLGNCEKKKNNMLLHPSSTSNNEWTSQPQNSDEKGSLGMDSSLSRRVLMEKPNQIQIQEQQQQQQQQQQAPLKCPRCDSSNTKFCYYNNYSLSQPRHFCKACKRYWTRGGTLRNVPVGGGCRKNKRVKRPSSSSATEAATTSSSSALTATSSNPNSNNTTTVLPQLDLSSNPLFYSLLTNNHHHHHPLFGTTSTANGTTYELHHHQPQIMSDLGLGFSSGLQDFRNINNIPSSNNISSLLSSSYSTNNPIFGSMSSASPSLHQRQKFGVNGNFHGFEVPYEDTQQMAKDVKMEWGGVAHGQNGQSDHIHEQINNSDQTLLWNTTGIGAAWLDPSNMGSSVPSLI